VSSYFSIFTQFSCLYFLEGSIHLYHNYFLFQIPPRVEHCPGDLWVVARNGSAVVSWDEPEFSDNIGISNVVERSGHRPGQSLLWGTYHIAYVAYDQAGNTATCSFKVYVLCKLNFQ
jgi:hypothetical protein